MQKYAVLAILLALVAAPPVLADGNLRLQEQEIEAGLLYNFLKYIEWPSASTAASPSTAVVCVFGADPFAGYLQPMAGRTVNQRRIEVRSVHDVDDAAKCQLVFVSADEKERWPQLQKSLMGKGVLTVSDFAEFIDDGGMIEFGRKDDHINVELNMDSVAAAKLQVEDRLLKLVTIVHSRKP